MTIPRIAKPMIGWHSSIGTQLCDHDVPAAVCDWCSEGES